MDTKLRHEKEISWNPTRTGRYREEQVKQLQEEYGYSHDDASKVFEIQEYKAT